MEYSRIETPPALSPWVECIWRLRGTLAPEGQTILPDGRMELVFHLGETPCEGSRKQPATLIAGQIRSAITLSASGAIDTIGVRLRPAAGGCLIPAKDLANATHDMEAVLGRWARVARERAGNSPDPVRRIVEAAGALLCQAPRPDPWVEASVEALQVRAGRGSIGEVIPAGLGPRQWERRFAAATGTSPKGFARILRLQEAIRLYETRQWERWADIALECGFYDQSHLANDFRGFSGQSPDRFFREGRALAEFYRDGFFQDGQRRHR